MVARLVLVLCLGAAFAFVANASGGKDFMQKARPAARSAIMTVAVETERPPARGETPAEPTKPVGRTNYERLMAWLEN